MTRFLGLILATLVPRTVHAVSNDDMFNFYETRDDTDYGPTDWNRVRCDDPDHCVSAAAGNAYLVWQNQNRLYSNDAFGICS